MNFNPAMSMKYKVFLTMREALRRVTKKVDLVPGPVQYNEDGLATGHSADFMKDPKFLAAYAEGERTNSWKGSQVHWRCYVCCWAAAHARNLEGDFVECGVNRGGYSRALVDYIDFNATGKTLYLMDTFNGLVDEQVTQAERRLGRSGGGYEECYDAVAETFRGYNVRLVRGAIPGTLAQVSTEKVAYLSIDMNCVEPEIAALEYFWPRLVHGGVVVHDDYGINGFALQKAALNQFAESRGVKVLTLPTGQGLLFKP